MTINTEDILGRFTKKKKYIRGERLVKKNIYIKGRGREAISNFYSVVFRKKS